MKITLLEHPRVASRDRSNDIANTTLSSCLNSGYAAAVLTEAGHTVSIVEGAMNGLSYTQIEEALTQNPPELLAVHLVYNWDDHKELYDFLMRVKSKLGITHITVYGYYPTFACEEVLANAQAVDSVICGEHELVITELAEHLKDWQGLQGLAYRDGSTVHKSFAPVVENLDALPFPVRTESSFPGGEANIFGSRGCYGNCTFCYINPFYGLTDAHGNARGKWRARTPENIAAEIDDVISRFGIRYFYFTDPNFYGPGQAGRQRVLALAALLKTRHITFGIEARANDIEPETVNALAEAGLTDILVGLESGRDASLARLGKHTTVEDNERALQILRDAGIEPSVGFIMFEPDSVPQDLRVNLEFLKRNKLLDRLDRTVNVLYHHQIILAGSSSYEAMKAEGKLVLSDHSAYEAETRYENPKTDALAHMMREVTNAIFDYMNHTWLLSTQDDVPTLRVYDALNTLLITAFEDGLRTAEAGGDIEALTAQVVKAVKELTA